jgi:hypothetical protein
MWHQHRSAPASAWLSASLGLLAGAALFAVLDAVVMRQASAESAFTRGIPRATLRDPSPARAVYRVALRAREGAESPSGASVAAHRWVIERQSPRPSDGPPEPVRGEDTTCVAQDGAARVNLALPLRSNEWGEPVHRPVPVRLQAVVPEASEEGARYLEWRVADGQRADVVGCVRMVDGARAFVDCGDGAPSRVFLLPSRAVARERAMGALERVSAAAAGFAVLCVLAGSAALRAWRRRVA